MSEHHVNALPQGYRLREYELVRVLGFGGFGLTYLGFDHHLDKAVALKEYLPSEIAARSSDNSVGPQASTFQEDFEWGLERFLDESRTLARFQHPNIVQVSRFFEAHGTAYIVMEYAEGETLAERLARQGTLSEAELLDMVLPLLDGLEAVHEANFLHRDIKPGNIIIRDADGSPVLLDFGSARQAIGAKSRSVTTVVTPGYAPIEQYSVRGNQGPWTDLYALGGVCYRALTGQVPEDATDRVRRDPLVPIGQLCGGQVSGATLGAIEWALQVDEEERPQSVAAWREVLADEVPPAAATPEVGTRVGKFWGVVVGLCLLLAGLGGYWALQETERAQQVEQAQQAEEAVRQAEAARQAELERQRAAAAQQAEAARQAELERQRAAAAQQAEEAESKRQAEAAARQAEQAQQRIGRRFKDCPQCPELVVVPAGSFTMGASASAAAGPQHLVRIAKPLAVGVYEVTFAEWDACVQAGGCSYRPNDEGWGRGNRPVINVSWNDAQGYIAWLSRHTGHSYRLLSEAEWEYAARAGTTTRYFWGDAIGHNRTVCNGCGSRWDDKQTAPAGTFSANGFGLHDVHGNVWEWVQDCWHDSYAGAPADGSAWVAGACGERVLRGGSWISGPNDIHSAHRVRIAPRIRDFDYGFRVGRTLTP